MNNKMKLQMELKNKFKKKIMKIVCDYMQTNLCEAFIIEVLESSKLTPMCNLFIKNNEVHHKVFKEKEIKEDE